MPKAQKGESDCEHIPDADVEAECEFTTPDQELKALRHGLLATLEFLIE
jgi:hypothetical protein